MLNLGITLICALFFLLSGSFIHGLKRIIQIIFTIILKLLNHLGFNLSNAERKLHTSKKFKETFTDVKVVKKSNKNMKLKSSINFIAAATLLVSLALIILNLNVISNNIVSKWLYSLQLGGTNIANVLHINS